MLAAVALMPLRASAFSPETYTETSRLATGRWMKVSVETDGLYMIPASTLRSWGFSDMERVRVYGYGGHRLPDILSEQTYKDDLPEVQTIVTDAGIIFYGLGAGEWLRAATSGNNYYYKHNDYATAGHYFVGECTDGTPRRSIPTSGTPGCDDPADSYIARAHYETERVPVPGEAGPELLGEDMLYTRTRTISIDAPGATSDGGTLVCSFVSSMNGTGQLNFTVNGSPLKSISTDKVQSTSQSSYIHANETLTAPSFQIAPTASGKYEVGITFSTSSRCTGAWLNYISINYKRRLALPSAGFLCFDTSDRALSLGGSKEGLIVLDVTDPHAATLCPTAETSSGTALWTAGESGTRTYAAWNPGATLPQPRTVGFAANQNLHADRDYDMVIVSPALFSEQAQRLADMHANSADTLRVKVVDPEQLYNEFSSGTTDAGAFRRYFKMLYDRGASGDGRQLRYAVMLGRTTLDNRGISTAASTFPTIPMWMTSGVRTSLSDNDGYCTDDVTAMLADGSGNNFARNKLSIAIGRIPVISLEEAKNVVDKAIQYSESAKKTAWKHRYMFLADDQDNGIHLRQTESLIRQFEGKSGQQNFIRKVYMDAYPFVGSNFPEARSTMFRYLDEGVVWWSFIGHANTTGWTAEGQLSYTDLNNMYLRHWPFIYAATCNFLRIDGNFISGGEILYKERYGGAIGMISATRPVYITDNGYFSDAIGRELTARDELGRLLPPGEIYRRAKNDIRTADGSPANSTNHLRYVFIGDPALRLAMPSNLVNITAMDGVEIADIPQPTLEALAQAELTGSITSPDGTLLSDFNGTVTLEIFDAERSRQTLGHGTTGTVEIFQDYGERIYCGSARVTDGIFKIKVAMPGEIAQNFTPATMSLYAYSDSDDTEAVGLNREFYAYGICEHTDTDTEAPSIDRLVLNHESFGNGDVVNVSPMLIASVSDNVGINVSTAGIGHQMTATLDGTKTFTDISLYYTPSADGSPSGVINYPFESLQPGNHTLALRVWDTAGNSASKEIDFFVQENLAPRIYEVYTDANPASTQANFYLSHDQPDNMVTVTISIYNLLGRPIWSGSATGRSDMFTTVPVTWDLSDAGGARVGRGIYLYRASITSDGTTYETATRRIAVTAR